LKSDRRLSEPGFTGFVDFQDWELESIYPVSKDVRLPFAKGHRNIKLLSCKSSYPANPGSDNSHPSL